MRATPEPGKLVDVGGHHLHLLALGHGAPTVVLESGGASWSLDWSLVQPSLAALTGTCAYDRAGLGWSGAGPLPRTGKQMALELHALLERAGVAKPYVLVGASFGGHVVRLFADLYPSEVAGVVLLDARHEDIDSRMPAAWKRVLSAGVIAQRFLGWAARWRVLKLIGLLIGEKALPPIVARLSAEARAVYLEAGFRPLSFETNLAELAACAESDRQVAAAGTLGQLPLTVVRHGVPDLLRAMPKAQAAEAERTWRELQVELAKLSTNSQTVTAEKSGHAIQVEQPELVIEVVRQMVETIRLDPARLA